MPLLCCLFVATILCLSFPVLAEGSKQPLFKVAFNNPGHGDKGFWKQVNDVMQAAASDLNIELHTWYADRDPLKMRQNGHEIFNSEIDFDYLILVNEHQQGTGFLRQSQLKNIKTLFLLNTVTETQQKTVGAPGEKFKTWLGSITPDNKQAGREMALSLIKHAEKHQWPSPTPVIMISGDNKTPASLFRNQGLLDVAAETGKLDIRHKFHALWSKERAQVFTHKLMQSAMDTPFVIWAANDNIAHGAIDGIEEVSPLKAGRDFAVAGLNWSSWGIDAVVDDQMTMTHGGHFLGGAWALITLYDHFHGIEIDAPEKHIRFKMAPLTKANISEYVAKLGDQNWNKIDFHRFSKHDNKDLNDYDFTVTNILAATK